MLWVEVYGKLYWNGSEAYYNALRRADLRDSGGEAVEGSGFQDVHDSYRDEEECLDIEDFDDDVDMYGP